MNTDKKMAIKEGIKFGLTSFAEIGIGFLSGAAIGLIVVHSGTTNTWKKVLMAFGGSVAAMMLADKVQAFTDEFVDDMGEIVDDINKAFEIRRSEKDIIDSELV